MSLKKRLKMINHETLPAIHDAKLPETYERAKTALAECSKLDECQAWADKAEALASYAKQAGDDTLRKMADRIQARAIRRAGELLKQIEPSKGGDPSLFIARDGTDPSVTRTQAATDAGLSERQRKTALRVANIDEQQFNDSVDSENPPTVTKLAEAGKKKRQLVNLNGRNPEEFNKAMHYVGMFRRYAEDLQSKDYSVLISILTQDEKEKIRRHIETIDSIHDQIITRI